MHALLKIVKANAKASSLIVETDWFADDNTFTVLFKKESMKGRTHEGKFQPMLVFTLSDSNQLVAIPDVESCESREPCVGGHVYMRGTYLRDYVKRMVKSLELPKQVAIDMTLFLDGLTA